jgi:hypothetical protein
MAKESKRVKTEAGKAMHSKSKRERSLAGEVLRQGQKRRGTAESDNKEIAGKPLCPTVGAVAEVWIKLPSRSAPPICSSKCLAPYPC